MRPAESRVRPAAPKGEEPYILRDVFPGALSLHLVPCVWGKARELEHHRRREERLAAPMRTFPVKGETRPFIPTNNGPVLVLRRQALATVAEGERFRRARPATALSELQQMLRSFCPCPVDRSLPQDRWLLDDQEIRRVLLEWEQEFALLTRVQLVDPAALAASYVLPGGTPDFAALTPPPAQTRIRYQLIPFYQEARTNDQTGQAQILYCAWEELQGDVVITPAARNAEKERIRLRLAYEAQGHWTLLVVDRLQRHVYLVDSTHEQHYRATYLLWQRQAGNPLRGWQSFDWQPEGVYQRDGWGCGYRVLSWIRYLMLHFYFGGYVPESRLPMQAFEYPHGPGPKDENNNDSKGAKKTA